jgi:hypothetical protein
VTVQHSGALGRSEDAEREKSIMTVAGAWQETFGPVTGLIVFGTLHDEIRIATDLS